MTLYTLVTFISVLACADFYPNWPSKLPAVKRIIIIDAGSTGSRIHVFTFEREAGRAEYQLEKDDAKEVEPGLSSFGTDAEKAAMSLEPLLDFAFKKVPEENHKDCPIEVKATAGLRSLSKEVANNILEMVDQFIRDNYDFKFTENKIAEILDGKDEGIFAWTSLNYLLGNWKPEFISTATLEIGGGSFQLTFQTDDPGDLPQAAQKNVITRKLAGLDRDIYVKSYLGLGTTEARSKFLLQNQEEGPDILNNTCLPKDYSGHWTHEGKKYQIEGIPDIGSHYDSCLALVKETLVNEITFVHELCEKELYALSYMYYEALNFKLIDDESGGQVTVADFVEAAQWFCGFRYLRKTHFEHDWEIFQCMDAAYVNYLLVDAFKLPLDFKVNVLKEVKGEETSWALGAAYHFLNKGS